VKAISLWQPWASAIALGLKRNETRSWSTHYRGIVAIHAARRDTRDLRCFFDRLMCKGAFYHPFQNASLFSFTSLPRGRVVAVAEISEIVTTEVALKVGIIFPLEMELGDYGINRFVWRMENIRPLTQPYFLKGMQGLFEIGDGVMDFLGERIDHEITNV